MVVNCYCDQQSTLVHPGQAHKCSLSLNRSWLFLLHTDWPYIGYGCLKKKQKMFSHASQVYGASSYIHIPIVIRCLMWSYIMQATFTSQFFFQVPNLDWVNLRANVSFFFLLILPRQGNERYTSTQVCQPLDSPTPYHKVDNTYCLHCFGNLGLSSQVLHKTIMPRSWIDTVCLIV